MSRCIIQDILKCLPKSCLQITLHLNCSLSWFVCFALPLCKRAASLSQLEEMYRRNAFADCADIADSKPLEVFHVAIDT